MVDIIYLNTQLTICCVHRDKRPCEWVKHVLLVVHVILVLLFFCIFEDKP